MTLSDPILASILGTLFVWVITKAVGYYVQRSRLKSAVLTDILLHQHGIKQQDIAIDAMFEKDGFLHVGKKIPFPVRYASDEWSLYKSLQGQLPFYLSKDTLRKIIKWYHLMWQLDQSMLGYAKALEDWEADQRKLSEADIEHLENRVKRMKSMARIIYDARIRRLSDLPEDFQGIKPMDTVLKPPNNH